MKIRFKTISRAAAVLLAVSLTAAGCSNDYMAQQNEENLLPILLSTGGQQEVSVSRTISHGNNWHSSDEIGVFVVSANGTLPGEIISEGGTAADNIKHTVVPHSTDASKASFNPSNTEEIIYYPNKGKVDIIAYHPHYVYGAGTIDDNCIYSIDITDQGTEEKQAALDMIYAKKTAVEPEAAAVNLEFDHLMSKITLHIKAGENVDVSDLATLGESDVVFNGMPVTANIALTAGACTPGSANEQAIFSPLKAESAPEGYQASFTAILIPQASEEYTNRMVSFTIGGRDYAWEIPDTEVFMAGNHYTYQVTVQKTGITITGYGIIPWNPIPEEIGVRAPGIYDAADLVAFSAQWNAAAAFTGEERKAAQDAVIADWSDNGRPDGVVRVRADIDMSNIENFNPIGSRTESYVRAFTGTFDGGHFTIANLKINWEADDYIGLFGYVSDAEIRNVILEQCDITGGYSVGGIVGSGNGSSVISNCSVRGGRITSNKNNTGGITGETQGGSLNGCTVKNVAVTTLASRSGGVAGFNNGGTIRKCDVYETTVAANVRNAAGIAGENNNGGVIEECRISGGVITANSTAGGIAGWNTGSNSEIKKCRVESASMISKSAQAGGIAGLNSSYATIRDCAAMKTTITAESNEAGGVAGQNALNCVISGCTVTGATVTAKKDDSGGITGQNNNGRIDNCHVETATVTAAENNAGGIVGENSESARIDGCSATETNIKAMANSGGIAGFNFGIVSGCPATKVIVEATKYSGGITGYNTMAVNACLTTNSTITANNSDSGGIAGYNYIGATITGCIASPDEVNAAVSKGVITGNNKAIVTSCYWGELGNLGANGAGTILLGGSFDRDNIDDFFTTLIGVNTPINLMNIALSTLTGDNTTPYRWKAGETGHYPVIYIP